MSSTVRDGSPFTTTRSACLPAAIVPIFASRPRYFAPFSVATEIASSGREPAVDEQLDLALIGEAGNHAAAAGRIGAGESAGRRRSRRRARAPCLSGTASCRAIAGSAARDRTRCWNCSRSGAIEHVEAAAASAGPA